MNQYTARQVRLIESLKDHGMDGSLILSPASIFYYTGFLSDPHERFMALAISPETGRAILFIPALDYEAASGIAAVDRIIPISDDQMPMEVVKEAIPKLSGPIGIEPKALNYERYVWLTQTFPDISIRDIEELISKQRLCKSAEEVASIKEAIRIIEQVMEDGVRKVRPGMTEAELTAELEYLMRMHGADGPSFSTIVLSGEKAALPHGSPGGRKIGAGDFLLIDMGVTKDGYCSDITRTFIIGEPTEKQRKIYDIVLRSNEAGIAASRGGVPLGSIDEASRKVIEDEGYGKFFNNRVGHGVGIEVHEAPSVHGKNTSLADPGNVFTIEPGIYIPGYGGVRIEDIVHIREDGQAEVLTAFPKTIRIIEA
ncbi:MULTISPECIES: M24 family metallopeptidase [Bhargavaea]|uniref:M24 family metallopeptidase n=1 Tax=Bhargavaea changchunensis TaxID=2134037 RepID=A0ABW2NDE2_9BACL|nr:Xaa-Pro peptidase family protein [Bhargavaea sp. CC-171006]